MILRHVVMCVWLGLLALYGSSEELPPASPHWLRHFTILIGQEMDVLERKVSPKVGEMLAEKLQPDATFKDIVKLLKTLTFEDEEKKLNQ